MMKRCLTVFLCLVSCLAVCAQTSYAKKAGFILGGAARLSYVAKTGSKCDFYVYNRDDEDGYVILAADDISDEQIVLGYSDEGSFDYDKLPDNAKWWLNQYSIQIEHLRENGITLKASDNTLDDDERHVVVYPLLGALKWGQRYPFDSKSPKKFNYKTKKDENCPTGCVANAMGQIMYYYRWPLNPTGRHSYIWGTQTLSADYSESEYDWALMKDKYVVYQISSEETDAISQLMYDCGVSVEMDFGLDGSSTYIRFIPTALKTYFRYRSANIVSRSQMGKDAWDNLLREQLAAFRPIIYTGQSDKEGHAFVCDGYDSEGYFHFNFGWGGMSDGYYLSSLTESYPSDHAIVCDIVPDRKKYKSEDIFYNMLNRADVEVACSDDVSDVYAGEISIPSATSDGFNVISVGYGAFTGTSIRKVELPSTVRRISGNAFVNCANLDTLVVNWNTPLYCEISAFDANVCSNTVLAVPSGRVSSYASNLPWSLFSNITDGSDVEEWTAWAPMGSGKGKYVSGFENLFDPLDAFVYQRFAKSDANRSQVRIDAVQQSMSLIVDIDMAAGNCKIRKQTTGVMNGSDEIIISDIPSFDPTQTYVSYPCVYDKELGTISLYVVYSSGGHAGQYYARCLDVLTLEMGPESAVDYILEDTWQGDMTYNVLGQPMSTPRRGISIRGGYKFLAE